MWNWQLKDWPKFVYESSLFADAEGVFMRLSGEAGAYLSNISKEEKELFREGPKGFKGGLRAENYISITKASRATATRDLNDLVNKGALVKQGELKYTRYYVNLDFF
jgi:Fic family protein